VPNERFPHGLPWLAEELRTRFGLRLGVWISPTDVADVSDVYKCTPTGCCAMRRASRA